MASDVSRFSSELLASLLEADSFDAAAKVLNQTSVPLDANVVERFFGALKQWELRGDPDTDRFRRAFSYVQEFRYRTSADHLASPTAVDFVRAIAAHSSPEEVNAFVGANRQRFDADVVEALMAAPYIVQPVDAAKVRMLTHLGGLASEGLQLKLRYIPPRQYRYFIQQLLAAYRERKMLGVLRENLVFVDLPMMYTLVQSLETLRAAGQLTADHIHFVESLGAHLVELPLNGVDGHELTVYLYEYLARLLGESGEPDRQAQVLVLVGSLRGARDPTAPATYMRQALQVTDVSTTVRFWLCCSLAEQLTSAPGDRASNVEEAIGWLEQAEQIAAGPEITVSRRALLQYLLGDAYRYRLAGDRLQNLAVAAQCFRQAAETCPPDTDACRHATALAGLGAVVGLSDEVHEVQKGIGLIDEALAIAAERNLPDFLDASAAGAQDYMDVALCLVEKSNLHLRAVDLGASGEVDKARQSAELALQQPTVMRDPPLLAAALISYGSAAVRMTSPPDEAEGKLRRAVEVAAAQSGCGGYAAVARFNLGRWYERRGELLLARDQYLGAVAELEGEAQRVGSSIEFRVDVERQVGPIYNRLVELLVRLGDMKEALDYLERGKARSLGEMIAAREALPAPTIPADLVEPYVRLRERKRYLENRSRMMRFGRRPHSHELADARRRLPATDHVIRVADVEVLVNQRMQEDVEARLEELLAAIREHDPQFNPAPRHTPLSLREIGEFLGTDRAIVQLMIGELGSYLFVLVPGPAADAELRVFSAPKATSDTLREILLTEWLDPYHRYREATQGGSPLIGQLRRAWRAAIESIGPRLADLLDFSRVVQHLQAAGIRHVIFVPYRHYHVLPLHLLSEEFQVSYAPSLAILKACHHRTSRGRSRGLLLENPDGSLEFSKLEIRLVQEFFPNSRRLVGDESRWDNVQSGMVDAEVVHYSGHAYFDPRTPLASALVLADRRLTLGEIMASSDLSASSLVVLSACETSRVSSLRGGDEYAGLPSGFLFAGAPSVVGTLWVVEDIAGPLAMQELYRGYIGGGLPPGEAFAAAIQRLRSISAADVLAAFGGSDTSEDPALDRLLTISRLQSDREAPLFEHPEYWAAFTLVGRA